MFIYLILLILTGFSSAFYAPIPPQVTYNSQCSEEVSSREENFQIESAAGPPLNDESTEELQRVPELPEEQVESTKQPVVQEKEADMGRNFAKMKFLDSAKIPNEIPNDWMREYDVMSMSKPIMKHKADHPLIDPASKEKIVNQMGGNKQLEQEISGQSSVMEPVKEVAKEDKSHLVEIKPDLKKEHYTITDQKEIEKHFEKLPNEGQSQLTEVVEPILERNSKPRLPVKQIYPESEAPKEPKEPEQTQTHSENVSNEPFDLKIIEDIFRNSTSSHEEKTIPLPLNPFEHPDTEQEEDTVIQPEPPMTEITPTESQPAQDELAEQSTTSQILIEAETPTTIPLSVIMTTITPSTPEPPMTTAATMEQATAGIEPGQYLKEPNQSVELQTTMRPEEGLDISEQNLRSKLETELPVLIKMNITSTPIYINSLDSPAKESQDIKKGDEVMEFLLNVIYELLTLLRMEKEAEPKQPQPEPSRFTQFINSLKCMGSRICHEIYSVPTVTARVPLKESANIPRKRESPNQNPSSGPCPCQRSYIYQVVGMLERIHRIRIAQGVHS